ncbi:MAG: hypothetical protein WCG27_12855 [Pseudomonadota bacterium]
MSNKKSIYVFKGFGFDVIIHNVEIKEIHGETYPDIDMNELKIITAKEVIKSREGLTGKKLKFLRTFLKLSYQELSKVVDVPPSTLRLWEEKGGDLSGLSIAQERQFRIHVLNFLVNLERNCIEKRIVMSNEFDLPDGGHPIDLGNIKLLKEA